MCTIEQERQVYILLTHYVKSGLFSSEVSRLKFISVFLFCFETITSSYSGGADGSSHRWGSLQGQQRDPLPPQVIAPEFLRKVNFCFCQ
jgi:hypothetical protein